MLEYGVVEPVASVPDEGLQGTLFYLQRRLGRVIQLGHISENAKVDHVVLDHGFQ